MKKNRQQSLKEKKIQEGRKKEESKDVEFYQFGFGWGFTSFYHEKFPDLKSCLALTPELGRMTIRVGSASWQFKFENRNTI